MWCANPAVAANATLDSERMNASQRPEQTSRSRVCANCTSSETVTLSNTKQASKTRLSRHLCSFRSK